MYCESLIGGISAHLEDCKGNPTLITARASGAADAAMP